METKLLSRGVAVGIALAVATLSPQRSHARQPEEQPSPEAQPPVAEPAPSEPAESATAEAQPVEPANEGTTPTTTGTTPAEQPLPEPPAPVEEDKPPPFRLEFYGFTMLDIGYQFKQNDPAWFDTLRPTKLPASNNEFGEDGHTFASVRQTRFGVKGFTPTDLGELQTIFEWELFGVGADAGQTTIRLRHAYGELGQIGAGQYWSPFMDIDVFPNSVEYWGPPGMAFFRNVQVRWMPIKGDTRLTFAVERPGASADAADPYAERIELEGVQFRFPYPDASGEFRYGSDWGYVELAGILRRIEWDDPDTSDNDLSDGVFGWGFNLSSNVKLGGDNVLKLSALYGEGIQNYMNDATADIGVEPNPGDPDQPLLGVAMPIVGLVAFVDWYWTKQWSSSAGYSMIWIDNASGQDPTDLEWGHYALGNLFYKPVPDFMVGGEFQWGRRENWNDDFTVNDYRIQFSFKWSFAGTLAHATESAE